MNKLFTQEQIRKIDIFIVILLLLMLFKTCNLNTSKVNKNINKNNEILIEKLNTIESNIKELPTNIDIKIEGLNVEKRLIQATDRKMMDVKRQSDIDKEIEKLLEKTK